MDQQVIKVYRDYVQNSSYTSHSGNYASLDAIVYNSCKRVMDLIIAGVGLVLAIPVVLFCSLAIKINSPGPIFYSQIRVGKDGKIFNIYKLRTMIDDAEKDGPRWAGKNDSRVTTVGQVLRKTRIDEIPQLLNVIKGEMSMIGPRPERPHFTLQFNGEIPGFVERLCIKPGLTGLAQIEGGYELTPAQKFELDKKYIEDQSILLDLSILIRTVVVVLTGHGAR